MNMRSTERGYDNKEGNLPEKIGVVRQGGGNGEWYGGGKARPNLNQGNENFVRARCC